MALTWQFLGPYLSSISASQRQQLVNLLNSQVQTGQLQTVAQYQYALTQELAEIAEFNSTPVFTLFPAPYQSITSSANYNSMETQAITALAIAYNEIALLDTAAQNFVQVMEGTLNSIESTLSTLEQQISILEILSNNTDGFVNYITDSFAESTSNTLSRATASSNFPWTITNIGFVSSVYDAQVDNGQLKLPISNTIQYTTALATLANQNPIGSSAIIASGIAAGIDNPSLDTAYTVTALLNGETWAETVDVPNLNIPVAQTDLVLELAGMQQINRIQIQPFTMYPYNITNISYNQNIGSGSTIQIVSSGSSILPITLDQQIVNIDFANIYAQEIILHITQNHYSLLRYIENSQTQTIQQIFNLATGQPISTGSLSDPNNFYYAMASNLQDLLDITSSGTVTIYDTYEFAYGMQAISLQQIQYAPIGIYVSESQTLSNIGAAGLETTQTIASPELASIQYDILVQYQDISASGIVTNSASIVYPILPASITIVQGEVLYTNPDTPYFMIATRFSTTGTSTIVVYQNGSQLPVSYYNITLNSNNQIIIQLSSLYLSLATINTSNFTIDYIPTSSAYVVPFQQHSQAIVNFRIFMQSFDPNKMSTPLIGSWSLKFAEYVSN